MPPHACFATGTAINHPEGLYMVNSDIGRELIWAAKRGFIDDWCIYVHWADSGLDYVLNNGDKITNARYIKQLVPCTDQAFARYRM